MTEPSIKVVALGDAAVVVRLCETLDRPEETLAGMLASVERLRAAKLPAVAEITPAFASIGVFFNSKSLAAATPAESTLESLIAKISAFVGQAKDAEKARQSRALEIPVCYEPEFAPDLALVAEHANLTEAEVVRRHSSAHYRVQCVGFTPGFPYLSGLPPELATPRRATPRKWVPPGSVAIAGRQSGIYPAASPGGWNVIGRAPLRLFDPQENPPALLQAGDRVRFRAITWEEFETAVAAVHDRRSDYGSISQPPRQS
ncbi:MAG: 5-oxoprolinase subunit PxpB [Chthoniobacterales bacterium]